MFFFYNFFDRAKEAKMYETKLPRMLLQKVVIVKEVLDLIDVDNIGNLEDLISVVFIDEKYGNLKVAIDVKELIRNINQKKNSGMNQIGENIFSEFRFFCGSVSRKCARKETF